MSIKSQSDLEELDWGSNFTTDVTYTVILVDVNDNYYTVECEYESDDKDDTKTPEPHILIKPENTGMSFEYSNNEWKYFDSWNDYREGVESENSTNVVSNKIKFLSKAELMELFEYPTEEDLDRDLKGELLTLIQARLIFDLEAVN